MDFINDEVVVYVEEVKNYVAIQFSDNDAETDNCDAAIDYTVYDQDLFELDGGNMDYNTDDKKYDTIIPAIKDIIDFHYDGDLEYKIIGNSITDIESAENEAEYLRKSAINCIYFFCDDIK